MKSPYGPFDISEKARGSETTVLLSNMFLSKMLVLQNQIDIAPVS